MAASPHELTIRIINSRRGEGGSSAESGGKAVDTAKGLINSSIVARELRSLGRQAVSTAVTNVSITTGNTVSQERLEYGLNSGAKLAAYGTALATGNVGAAALMAINDTMSILTRATQIALQNNVERESLALSRDRAGIAFNQSRMGGAK